MVSALINMMTRPAAKKESEKMFFAESLPLASKFFVQRNFPNRSIAFMEMKTSSKGAMYLVTLNDGIQINFNENGSWEMVDCKMEAVPSKLVPDMVSTFMDAHYSSIPLVKIEKKSYGFEATLSNYATLKFDTAEKVA